MIQCLHSIIKTTIIKKNNDNNSELVKTTLIKKCRTRYLILNIKQWIKRALAS